MHCLFVVGGVVRVAVACCVMLSCVAVCCFSLLVKRCELKSFVGRRVSLLLFVIGCC